MRLKRPLVIIPAAIAILALAALLLLPLAAMTPWARRAAGNWIAETAGLPARVERLRLGWLRGPSLELGGLSLAQPAGFGEAAIVEIGRARIEAPWATLFGGIALRTITIEDAVLRPAIAADGADNWSALIERLDGLGGEGEADWSIGRLEVLRGALEFENAVSETRWRLTAITLTADGASPGAGFPLELSLAGVFGPNTFHFAANGTARLDPDTGNYRAQALNYRGWVGGEPLPLAGIELAGRLESVAWAAASESANFTGGTFNLAGVPGAFDGRLELGGPELRMQLSVKTEAFAPRAAAVAIGRPLPRTADPDAFGLVQASFACTLAEGLLTFDPIEAQLDDTKITVRAVPQQRLLRLQADRIELDRYLAPDDESRREKKATLEAAVAQLRELDLDAEIRIEEARVAGAKLSDVVLRIERRQAGE
ncbi:MAG: AsmA family protein [Gammaproteobacteria bacterium]